VTTVELPVPPAPAVDAAARLPRSAPVCLALPGRTLLLVAGMPGAGKSTLLAGLPRGRGLVVLDSDEQRRALVRRLPGVTYRRYRWLVHLRHRLAVVRAALSSAPTVVVHLPATAGSARAAVALLAALSGRTAHLLWLHVEPEEAVRGQRDRGRLVPPRSFAGHARRALAATASLSRGRPSGWRTVTVVDRGRLGAGLVLDTRGPQ
jgi:predicted kinase